MEDPNDQDRGWRQTDRTTRATSLEITIAMAVIVIVGIFVLAFAVPPAPHSPVGAPTLTSKIDGADHGHR